MYKVLSNLKFMGKLYVKGDDVDLEKKIGEQLAKDGVVELLEKTQEEDIDDKTNVDNGVDEAQKARDEEKAKKDEEDSVKEYKDMGEDELINTLEAREIDHKDMSQEEAIEALERSDRVRDKNS